MSLFNSLLDALDVVAQARRTVRVGDFTEQGQGVEGDLAEGSAGEASAALGHLPQSQGDAGAGALAETAHLDVKTSRIVTCNHGSPFNCG